MKDINVTKRLVKAGKSLEIEVLDHLVVNSDNSFASLKEIIFKMEKQFPFFFKIYLSFNRFGSMIIRMKSSNDLYSAIGHLIE